MLGRGDPWDRKGWRKLGIVGKVASFVVSLLRIPLR